jgi:hypothetical protein
VLFEVLAQVGGDFADAGLVARAEDEELPVEAGGGWLG